MTQSINMSIDVSNFGPVMKTYQILNELLEDTRIPQDVRDEYEKRFQEVIDDG